MTWPIVNWSKRPVGWSGNESGATVEARRRRTERVGDLGERFDAVFVGMGEMQDRRAVGRAPARLAGVGEERDGWRRADEHQLLERRQRLDQLFREVRQPLDHDPPGATLEARRERVAEQPGAGRRSDASRSDQTLAAQRRATQTGSPSACRCAAPRLLRRPRPRTTA